MEKLENIINTIRKNKGLNDTVAINANTKLREDLDFDSFDLAELTVHIEESFGVDIFESGIVESIGDICAKLKIK